MAKHISDAQSATICRVYKEQKGRWRDVMADADIIETGLERAHVERHIRYKKNLLAAKKAPPKRNSHAKVGDDVLAILRELDEEQEEDDDDDGGSPLATTEDDSAPAPDPVKREPPEREEEAAPAPKKPRLKRQLSDASMHLDELNRELLGASVASDDVEAAQHVADERPPPRRRGGTERSDSLTRAVKQHLESIEQHATTQETLQLMGLRMMQQMMRGDDQAEATLRQDVQALTASVGVLAHNIEQMMDRLTALERQ